MKMERKHWIVVAVALVVLGVSAVARSSMWNPYYLKWVKSEMSCRNGH